MKKRKILKKIGLSILAGFMFCMPVLSAACTPLLALPEQESQETNYDLGLNPETDPVVFTTESGLQIKKSNAKYTSTTTTTTNNGNTYTQDLTSFYYFTMGKFSGTIYTAKNTTESYQVNNEPVNWLILARGNGFEFWDSTPAGSSIQTDMPKQEIAITPNGYLPMSMSTIPKNPADEIPNNCFLVISEKILGQMYFNGSGAINSLLYTSLSYSYMIHIDPSYGNRYRYKGSKNTASTGGQSWNTISNAGGALYNYINNLFSKNHLTGAIEGENNLGFTEMQANMIVPQQLYTYYSNGPGYNYAETPNTDGGTYYSMFPLAYRTAHTATKQNFCAEDYFSNDSQRVASLIGSNQSYFWWLRSGGSTGARHCFSVYPSGTYHWDHYYHDSADRCSHGVRPAMVIKIM